eukprot:scaffold26464_cov80-Cyclotella_meneghiniana.AAC.2
MEYVFMLRDVFLVILACLQQWLKGHFSLVFAAESSRSFVSVPPPAPDPLVPDVSSIYDQPLPARLVFRAYLLEWLFIIRDATLIPVLPPVFLPTPEPDLPVGRRRLRCRPSFFHLQLAVLLCSIIPVSGSPTSANLLVVSCLPWFWCWLLRSSALLISGWILTTAANGTAHLLSGSLVCGVLRCALWYTLFPPRLSRRHAWSIRVVLSLLYVLWNCFWNCFSYSWWSIIQWSLLLFAWSITRLYNRPSVAPASPSTRFRVPSWPEFTIDYIIDPTSQWFTLPRGVDASTDFDLDVVDMAADCPFTSYFDDTLDDYAFGIQELGTVLFGLSDAGYDFEVHVSTTSRVSSGSWRWRRTCMRRWKRRQRPKSSHSSPLTPTQPTFDQRVHRFVASFNPAFAIRPFLPSCWRPSNPTVSVHLHDHTPVLNSVLSGLGSLLARLTVIQFFARLARCILCCALVTPVLTWCLTFKPVKRVASFCGAVMVLNVKLPTECPLVVDTGASVCVTPHRRDFKPGTYKASDMKLRDLSGVNGVRGEGIIQWPVRTSDGATVLVEVPGFHVETAGVRLLSPQVLHTTLPGSGYSMTDKVSAITLPDDRVLPAPISSSNLPELSLSTDPVVVDSTFGIRAFTFDSALASEWDVHLNVCDKSNKNLTSSERELLLWHHRLSHFHIEGVQSLLRDSKWLRVHEDPKSALHQGPILPSKHQRTCSTSRDLKCAACLMAKSQRRTPSSSRTKASSSGEKSLKTSHLSPGDCISCDHYVSPERGRNLDGFGKATASNGYTGGAIYVDHASGKIFHFPQTSLSASETLREKQTVERAASDLGFRVKAYHSDNGIFASTEFQEHCNSLGQKLSYSGVGAHHQNGVAERSIGTVCRLARANIIHLLLHWPDQCRIYLWPFAMNYAVWIYNRIPNPSLGGLSPDEFWSRSRSDHSDLRRAHVFGCPVYVLDPALQDGKSIPKWNARARMGVFVGYSHQHSSLVPLVLNPSTGYVSPQYHVIFDDKFASVASSQSSIDDLHITWSELFRTSRDFYLDPEEVESGDVIPPQLSADWNHPDTRVPEGARAPEGDSPSEGVSASDGTPASEGASAKRYPSRRTRNTNPIHLAIPIATALATWADPPAAYLNTTKSSPHSLGEPVTLRPQAKVSHASLAESTLLHSPWEEVATAFSVGFSSSSLASSWELEHGTSVCEPHAYKVSSLFEPDLSPLDSATDCIVDHAHPHVFSVKANANSEDNPTYDEAMRGPYAKEYTDAAATELHTLQNDLDCWELVEREDWMNVLPSTWAFKCKRYPDGRVKKFKARFCARGDRQKEGVDYFDTWSPVVSWTTVRCMLILSILLDLKTVQADITAAFVHAELPPEEEVYIHQPRGFIAPGTSTKTHVLKLKRALYGLKQAPRHFFKYLSSHLEKHRLVQSRFDPCLFIGKEVIVIVYMDDLLIYSKTRDPIVNLIEKLQHDGIKLREEGEAEGFLGVDIKRDPNGSSTGITLTQTGLISRIITALGMDSVYTTKKDTPAEASPLPKDVDGEPADPTFPYASIIGMLLYLSGHSRPDIAFAVHQCARYTFKPTKRHVAALKRIGRYLKGTKSKGLILNPSKHLHVDCYPDADFAGLYGHEDKQDPHCVRSRTGYVILLANCPILWKSKLQTEIALSTMEAEYVALSQSCKDLFPLLDQIMELANAVHLSVDEMSKMHIKIHEDNVGALTLGKLEPKRMTPRSKHYAIKYHWFREQIGPRNIQLEKVASSEQLGDIFTKGLSAHPFSYLRSKLMGW